MISAPLNGEESVDGGLILKNTEAGIHSACNYILVIPFLRRYTVMLPGCLVI